MATAFALLLVLFLLMRPMDIWPWMGKLHTLEAFAFMTAVGIGLDTSRGQRPSGASPQFGWLFGFFAWAWLVTIARHGVDHGAKAAWAITLGPIFMLLVIYALRDADRLRWIARLLIACTAFVSVVAVHQGNQPLECVELQKEEGEEEPEMVPDGRECEGARACEENGKPGIDYVCERAGLFGTFSTAGRVRWRGQLDDPNEVAVLICAVVPFLAMFAARRRGDEGLGEEGRSPFAVLVSLVLLGVGLWAMVYTQSRGGQLILGIVVASVLVRRYGWWSVLGAAALVAPIALLSWRAGEAADSSASERAEILNEGLLMLKAHPFLGIGIGQFAGENPMNMAAHNSYLLVATETGLFGYFLWCGLLWTTMKIPLVISRRPPFGIDPLLVSFADALTVSLLGMLIGVFFLSFVYKSIFFVWIGLAGALYAAVRVEAPEFRVTLGAKDYAGIVGLVVVSLAAVKLVSMTVR